MSTFPADSVRDQVEQHATWFDQTVRARLVDARNHDDMKLPEPGDPTHPGMAELVSVMLSGLDRHGRPGAETLDWLTDLVQRDRRYGFPAHTYQRLEDHLSATIRNLCADLPYGDVFHAEQVIISSLQHMRSAAVEAEEARVPGAIGATVVEVERRSRRFSVVRLQADAPLLYRAGDFVPVTTGYRRDMWRYLCPSIPPNEWGQVEFHIEILPDSTASQLLATPRVGDRWQIGRGAGDFAAPTEDDMLLVAHTTGLAPVRALLLEVMQRGNPPRVHLFFGADYPGELYELLGLWNFAAASPWLAVTPVVEKPTDAWWVQATEASHAPRGLHLQVEGTLADVVPSYGAWADRQIYIAGPSEHVLSTRRAMIRGGTPRDQIQYLGF